MPRLSIEQLEPLPKYRKPKWSGTRFIQFGSTEALVEDTRRVTALRRSLPTLSHKDAVEAQHLAEELSYVATPPAIAASSGYFHQVKEPFVDHMVRLAAKVPPDELKAGALLPQRERRATLDEFDPSRFKERLRHDLRRVGAASARGWLIAGVHGEYDSGRELFDPHYHVIVGGKKMIAAVEQLRQVGKYKLADSQDFAAIPDRAPPVRLRRVERQSLRYALSYVLQAYWPERWTGLVDGERLIRRGRQRMTDRVHTEFLLWLAKQQVSNLVLLQHLFVGKDGLRPTSLGKCTPIKKR